LLTSASFNRVVTRTKADATYAEIRRLILSGELAGDTVLNQDQLATSLGVSTTPLREALRRLESEGLVEMRAKGHVVVTKVDAALLPHILVVREDLDCLAVQLAARAATPRDHAALHAALAIEPKDWGHMEDWMTNTNFHRTIHRATHNPVLEAHLGRLCDQYDRYYAEFTDVAFDEVARSEHRAIVEAIEAGRGDAGAAIMHTHYSRGRETILSALS
jgi:DNA-binding GntR family transcriptional regulator